MREVLMTDVAFNLITEFDKSLKKTIQAVETYGAILLGQNVSREEFTKLRAQMAKVIKEHMEHCTNKFNEAIKENKDDEMLLHIIKSLKEIHR